MLAAQRSSGARKARRINRDHVFAWGDPFEAICAGCVCGGSKQDATITRIQGHGCAFHACSLWVRHMTAYGSSRLRKNCCRDDEHESKSWQAPAEILLHGVSFPFPFEGLSKTR